MSGRLMTMPSHLRRPLFEAFQRMKKKPPPTASARRRGHQPMSVSLIQIITLVCSGNGLFIDSKIFTIFGITPTKIPMSRPNAAIIIKTGYMRAD